MHEFAASGINVHCAYAISKCTRTQQLTTRLQTVLVCVPYGGMPRPPKPSNARNPLRLLRIALADKNQAMMTQPKLGEILGISPETIKSLEVGRRHQGALSHQIVTAAVVYCGAKWNPK